MQLSLSQKLANCKYALKMWKTIPNENITPDLLYWINSYGISEPTATCNTIACFGGWCVFMPKFQELGLYFDSDGAPTLTLAPKITKGLPRTLSGYDLAFYLFGDGSMFYSNNTKLTDRDIVWVRLENQMVFLKQAIRKAHDI
jgi:hypothetical protein